MELLDDLTRRTIAAEMDRLRNHVDYVCDCELKPATTPGAINWGDLGCVAAALSVNSCGNSGKRYPAGGYHICNSTRPTTAGNTYQP